MSTVTQAYRRNAAPVESRHFPEDAVDVAMRLYRLPGREWVRAQIRSRPTIRSAPAARIAFADSLDVLSPRQELALLGYSRFSSSKVKRRVRWLLTPMPGSASRGAGSKRARAAPALEASGAPAARRARSAQLLAHQLIGASQSLFTCKALIENWMEMGVLRRRALSLSGPLRTPPPPPPSTTASRRPTAERPILIGLHCGGIASFSAAFEALGLPAKVVWATEVRMESPSPGAGEPRTSTRPSPQVCSNPGAIRFLEMVEGAKVVVVNTERRYRDELGRETLVRVDIEVHSPPCNGFSGAMHTGKGDEAARIPNAEYTVNLWEEASAARWMDPALRPTLVVIENSPCILHSGFSARHGFRARIEEALKRPAERAREDGVLGARYDLEVRCPGEEAPRGRGYGALYLGSVPE